MKHPRSSARSLTTEEGTDSSREPGLRGARVAALALVCALLGGAAMRAFWPHAVQRVAETGRVQSELIAPPGTRIDPYQGPPAVSLDGARVAFSAIDGMGRHIIPDQEFVAKYGVGSAFGNAMMLDLRTFLVTIVFAQGEVVRKDATALLELANPLGVQGSACKARGQIFTAC